ncbi:MAG: homocysteine biosynthesis protein [Deltaproteobacteria bacterium]|nr:homocysteine biosynthesis protein [Deltaproteobacteria bacterium]
MTKTYEEINERIRNRKAVVVTAEEMIDIVEEKGSAAAAREVDVVTTGTFGPMCSSGAMLNVGHTTPRMKITRAWLNDVPAYCGLAAIDMYVGATEVQEGDPLNKVFPGAFGYGGAHVIEDLIRGKDVVLRAEAYGTDCYPRKNLETLIRLEEMNQAVLLNPRNGYQNYNVAVNASKPKPIYTYLGVLRPKTANANYCSAGQLSPLLNDPHYRTIGIGTRIFLGGGVGYVYFQGTQHNPGVTRTEGGIPKGGAGTIAVTGDLKAMSAEYVRAASITGYGVSLTVGIGIPIPVLDEQMARFTAVKDSDIVAPVIDYGESYPNNTGAPLGHVTYAELKSGTIEVGGKRIRTAGLSSTSRARQIAEELKERIEEGSFLVGKPVELLPGAESGVTFKMLEDRPPPRNGRGAVP